MKHTTHMRMQQSQSRKHHNSQYQQKYAYQLQQSDKACHIKHTPLHNIIYDNAKSTVFTQQYDQCGNSTE